MRLLLIGVLAVASTQAGSVQRTVYVTAAAADGSGLAGLDAADVIVTEGGQPRHVRRVEPSRAKLRVAVVVEELLTPDNEVRRAVANFIDQIRTSGDLALYVASRRTEKRVDYSSDVVPFASAINRFPARAVEPGNLVQALQEIARDQRALEGRRAIVAVAVETAQVSGVTAEAVLEQLRAGGAVFYAATLAGFELSTAPAGVTSGGRRLELEGQVAGLERDRVFAEGTRKSGGLHLTTPRTTGLWNALERVAAELQRQYIVSYDGDARSEGSLTIAAARPGLSVRGPGGK